LNLARKRPKGSAKTGSHKKGAPNKTTLALKDAILEAAKRAGDKLGPDGMVSYLLQIAETDIRTFVPLLGRHTVEGGDKSINVNAGFTWGPVQEPEFK